MLRLLQPVLALALLAAAPSPAPAATEQSPPAAAEPAQAPDDGELGAFVNAFVRMIGVQHAYMMMMHSESDPARIETLREEAVADMTEAIEQDGLSIERYNAIALAVRDDPGLQTRVEAILEQLAAAPPEEE